MRSKPPAGASSVNTAANETMVGGLVSVSSNELAYPVRAAERFRRLLGRRSEERAQPEIDEKRARDQVEWPVIRQHEARDTGESESGDECVDRIAGCDTKTRTHAEAPALRERPAHAK